MTNHRKSDAKKDYRYGGVITELERSKLYLVDFTLDGNRKKKRVRGTKSEAVAYLESLVDSYKSGIDIASKDLTYEEYSRSYFDSLRESGNVRESTMQQYEVTQKKVFTVKRFIKKPLSAISSSDINSLYSVLRRNGTGATTLHQVHVQVKRIFSAAFEDRIIQFSPVNRNVNVPPLPETNRHALARVDAAALRDTLVSIDPKPFSIAAIIALSTGLRIGEILALRWCDIVMDENPHFMATKQIPKSGKVTERKTSRSGKKPNPWVPIDPFLLTVLKAYRIYQRETLASVGIGQSAETPICANEFGGWPDQANIRNHFKQFCVAHGFAEWVDDEGRPFVQVTIDSHGQPSCTLPEGAIGEYFDYEGWPVDENGRRYSRTYRKPKRTKHYQGLKFHELRRTNFTLRLDAGESIKTLQAHGGWFSPRMLLETYSESVEASVKTAPCFLESLGEPDAVYECP